MPEVAVFLSNPGHHVAMLAPAVEELVRRGRSCRVHSFCELRGFASPGTAFAAIGAEVLPAWPAALRRPAAGSAGETALGSGPRRDLARAIAWRLVLAPRLERQLSAHTRLAVLPNDSAFPYDRLAVLLRRREIPFVLVQEGIRFPLPAERASRYGLGGARALAVWGEASAAHFRALGVDPARIHVTGSPRFDHRPAISRAASRRDAQQPVALLLITNPIDAQGFCGNAEKKALVARFVSCLEGALADGRVTLTLRPHPGETSEAYAAALDPAHRHLVAFAPGGDLEAALAATDVALVMASTVGLEALLHGVPLAVLPTPGHGFVHDYVERGAALGLALDASLEGLLIEHASPAPVYRRAVSAYLDDHLAHSGQATGRLVQLMIDLL